MQALRTPPPSQKLYRIAELRTSMRVELDGATCLYTDTSTRYINALHERDERGETTQRAGEYKIRGSPTRPCHPPGGFKDLAQRARCFAGSEGGGRIIFSSAYGVNVYPPA